MELPRQRDLDAVAPEKHPVQIGRAMNVVRDGIVEAREDRAKVERAGAPRKPIAFAPAGQATQMIVGATSATDADVLQTSAMLYTRQLIKRVFYSAFSPIPDATAFAAAGRATAVARTPPLSGGLADALLWVRRT